MSALHKQLRGLMSYVPAFAAFLVFPAFLQGQTSTLNEAIHPAEAHNRAIQVAKLNQRKTADEASEARSYRFPHFLPLDRPDAVVQQIETALYSAYLWPKKADANIRRIFSWNN